MGHYGHVDFHKIPVDFRRSSVENVRADGYWAVDAQRGQPLHFEDREGAARVYVVR